MKIRTYDSQISAQGEIAGARASGEDFGAQVGRAETGLAQSAGEVLNYGEKLSMARQQVWNNQMQSTAELEATKQLQAASTDPDFAKKYGADGAGFSAAFEEILNKQKGEIVGAAPSPWAARQLSMGLDETNKRLMAKANAYQAQFGGNYVKTQVETMMQTDAQIVRLDPSQTSAVIDRGKVAIANLPLLDNEVRTKLLKDYEDNIHMAVGSHAVIHRPGELLAAIAPDVMATFKQAPKTAAAANGGNTMDLPVTVFPQAYVSEQVLQYSPIIRSSAAANNVDANLMAAQIQVESSGRSDVMNMKDIAVTGSPSMGIAQFQPATAAQFGVKDPLDPNQAIPGMAKMNAYLLKKFGGDYRKALAAYNWGEGNVQKAIDKYGEAWESYAPESTQKYIDKIFSLTSGDAAPVPEPSRAPTNPDWFNKLDWKQQDSLIQKAEQGVRANQVRDAQAAAAVQREKDAAQEKTLQGMLPTLEAGKLTPQDVLLDATLDVAHKEHMLSAIRLQSERAVAGNNPQAVRDLTLRIHAPDDDPNKIYSNEPVYAALGRGEISVNEFKTLSNDIAQLKDGSTNGFQKDVNSVRNLVFRGMQADMRMQAMMYTDSGVLADTSYRFNADFDKKIEEYRKQNKDPRVLLDPTSKEYILAPGRVQSFYPVTATKINQAASKVAKEELAKLPTYKEYDNLEPGATFTDKDGNIRTKPAASGGIEVGP